MSVFVRSPYNYDVDAVSIDTGLECKDESKAQQHQKEEADINTIVRKFIKTGELPPTFRAPQYGDFTGVTDYQSALESVRHAEESFMMLPAELRQRFDNNPEVFVEFCSDSANLDEMRKLGLVKPASEPAPEPEQPPVEGGT